MSRRTEKPVWLASSSPRRRILLDEAGLSYRLLMPRVDDGTLVRSGQSPDHWVVEVARWKARAALEQLREADEAPAGTILAADTMCVDGDLALGKPRDAVHARAMIEHLADAEHITMTGVCLLWARDGVEETWCDRTIVRIGHLNSEEVESYVSSRAWEGKAGGYNLSERIDAGWPIEVIGDPTTVMGLPMERLKARLAT